jgi:hypothetical protein
MAKKTALIVGASGIVGRNLATHLATQVDCWSVYGLARKPAAIDGVQSISADLLRPELLRQSLATLEPTHIFLATWMRQPTEAENIRVNSAMVRNLHPFPAPRGKASVGKPPRGDGTANRPTAFRMCPASPPRSRRRCGTFAGGWRESRGNSGPAGLVLTATHNPGGRLFGERSGRCDAHAANFLERAASQEDRTTQKAGKKNPKFCLAISRFSRTHSMDSTLSSSRFERTKSGRLSARIVPTRVKPRAGRFLMFVR